MFQKIFQTLRTIKTFLQTQKVNIMETARRSNVAVESRSSFRPYEDSPASKSQGHNELDGRLVLDDKENNPPHKRRKNVTGPIEAPQIKNQVLEGPNTALTLNIENPEEGCRYDASREGWSSSPPPVFRGSRLQWGNGCYSGGYENDIDNGEYFTYTAPQIKNQVLEGPNTALTLNIENPEEGCRYDGFSEPTEDGDQIEDPFLGWDFDNEDVEFLGFDLGDEPLFRGFEENPESLQKLSNNE